MKQLTAILFACLFFINCALAESQSTKEGKASASLDFKVVVPSVVKIKTNIRPNTTSVGENKEELLITHNLARLCLIAEITTFDPAWTITVEGNEWEVVRYFNYYTLCSFTRGQVELKMTHTFTYPGIPWPVRLTVNPV